MFFSPREVNAQMGGIERVTDNLARLLIAVGHNVVFMSVDKTSDKPYDCAAPQYFTKTSNNKAWILDVIKKYQVDIVINQMGFFSYCPKASLPSSVKVITVMHDSYYAIYPRLQLNFLRKWNWRRVIKKEMRQVYNQSDKIVVFIPPFKEEFKFFYPKAKNDKFSVIPNYNTYKKLVPGPKEKKLLWIGRFSELNKRTCDILKIWHNLESSFPDWSLDILGSGPDEEKVRMLHEKLGLKRCYLRGTQNPKPYYEKAAVFCMTSAFESFGMVLTEAMQHGCVPIAYDSFTAVRYIIHNGVDGELVKPFNIDEYTVRLTHLMSDNSYLKRLSDKAIESVKQFDVEKIFPMWLDLLASL